MGLLAWVRGLFKPSAARARDAGLPRSANGASSFHLAWELPPGTGPLAEVSAVLTVVDQPAVSRLYFWALQVSFAGSGGAGAHIGLQWLPSTPGRRAANWGGYRGGGGELDGTPPGNTHPFPWKVGFPYTLTVRRGVDADGWAGTIAGGGEVFARELHVPGGSALSDPMVWSEVFARCDDQSVTVRWEDLRAVTVDGRVVRPEAVRVNYQSAAEGGCANTDSRVEGAALVQTTCAERRTPQGAVLRVEA